MITVVSMVLIILILSMSIRSRKRETGILLAVGIAKPAVILQYVLETLLIAVVAFPLAYLSSKQVAGTLGTLFGKAAENVIVTPQHFMLVAIVGGILVYGLAHGFSGLLETLESLLVNSPLGSLSDLTTTESLHQRFTSLVARGASKDIGSGLSLILGVLSTQTYAQAIWSAKSDSTARKGALLSALLIPPIGIACILIGLYMRGHCITADEVAALQAMGQTIPDGLIQLDSSAQVFPVFAATFLPHLMGGIVLGTLFITVVGGGSGLALGMASILVTDIFARKSKRVKESSRTNLIVTRSTIMVILVAAVIVAVLVPGAMINDFGFLSMGLRGAVVFLPMCGGLWLKGKIPGRYALVSIFAGPIAVLAGNFLPLPFDALFLGMAVCLVILAVGLAAGKHNSANVPTH